MRSQVALLHIRCSRFVPFTADDVLLPPLPPAYFLCVTLGVEVPDPGVAGADLVQTRLQGL